MSKRYFVIHFDHVAFSAVATDPAHAIDLVRQWYANIGDDEYDFDRLFERGKELNIRELTAAAAAERNGFDDARDGGSYPLNTFEIGALLSSEY